MLRLWVWSAVFLSLLGATLLPVRVRAARGTPETAEFGYGARLNIDGLLVSEGIQATAELQTDWIGIDLDWAGHWADPNLQPELAWIDQAMQSAASHQTPVMLSITNPPAWARTPDGPDPQMTAWFVVNLARRYPSLEAVELFPGANTSAGWAGQPNPQAYLNLLKTTQTALQEAGESLYLPAGGLLPLGAGSASGDIEAAEFLTRLYQAGAASFSPIISLRLPKLSGDPFQFPDPSGSNSLRTYELIRQVMLANNHSNGILWITELSAPVGGDPGQDIDHHQAQWLVQAYQQLRSQLFIGVVFYETINPANSGGPVGSLLSTGPRTHPFFGILKQLIAQNNRDYDVLQLTETQVKNINKENP